MTPLKTSMKLSKHLIYTVPLVQVMIITIVGTLRITRKKIYGFTIEFGLNEQSFQPPWDKMKEYVIEVSFQVYHLFVML